MSTYNNYATNWIHKKSSSQHYAHQYLEKPAMYQKLPDLKNLRVLCLGCGSAEECQELLDQGASFVLAIDLSQGLVDYAKTVYANEIIDGKIDFICGDIDDLDQLLVDYFGLITNSLDNQFDFIFSSLTIHYICNWQKVFCTIKNYMGQGAKALFSCHHPIKWGAKTLRGKESNSFVLGYKKYKSNSNIKNQLDDYEIYGDYLTTRAIEDKLFGQLDITYYHKSISQIFLDVSRSGLILSDLLEPLPQIETKTTKPDFYYTYAKIPLFLIFELSKV